MLKMGSEKKKKRSRASTKSMISFNDIESMLLNLALVSARARPRGTSAASSSSPRASSFS